MNAYENLGLIALVSGVVFSNSVFAQTEPVASPRVQFEAQSDWRLRAPTETEIPFTGAVNFDTAGAEHNGMLYPAPNLIAMLAAVATHGTIVESAKSAQKIKMQDAANKVMLPYKGVLSTFTPTELMQQGVAGVASCKDKNLYSANESARTSWQIESHPVFTMTQDESTLILDNTVAIYAPDNASTPIYTNIVRVISQAKSGEKLAELWLANKGEQLRQTSIRMFSHSLDIAVTNAAVNDAANATPTYKTVRYLEGKTERMERAQVLNDNCGRKTLRNLRGWLMSVPVKLDDNAATQCQKLALQI